jgi:hypothetical protein
MIGSLSCSQQRLRIGCQPLQLCSAAAAGKLRARGRILSCKRPRQVAAYSHDSYVTNDSGSVAEAQPAQADCADAHATLRHALPQEQQQQQQQQRQNWLLHFLQGPRVAKVLAAAALLALLPGPGSRSQALAAALPPPWQAIHTPVTSSSSSRRESALQQEAIPSYSGAVQLGALLGSNSYSGLVDQPATHTGSSSSSPETAMSAVTSRLLGSSSRSMISNSSSSSSTAATFPIPSSSTSPGSSSSSANPSSGSSSSSSSSSSGASAAPAAAAAAAGSSGVDDLLGYERAAVSLFAAAVPSVVNITHMRAMQVRLNVTCLILNWHVAWSCCWL